MAPIPVEHADQAGNKAYIEDVGDNGGYCLLALRCECPAGGQSAPSFGRRSEGGERLSADLRFLGDDKD